MSIAERVKGSPLLYEFAKRIMHPLDKVKRKRFEDRFKNYTYRDLMDYDASLYHKRQGRNLNWERLVTYTEKMQYEKLFNHDPIKSRLTDKVGVRSWVSERIGEEYLIPIVGAYDKYRDIPFHDLPNQFVIKTNHGSGDVIIIKDKRNMSLAERMRMKRVICDSMETNYAYFACEMHYSDIHPQIIIEEYIDSGDVDLQDYKFLCFGGKVYYCWVDVGRFHEHKRNIYDTEWNLQSWNQYSYGNYEKAIEKPKNFEKMLDIAQTLSQGFPHVRVDLYNIDGKIYFGEMTFTNGSGFEPLTPEYADKMLGDLWDMDTTLPDINQTICQ